MGNRGIILLKQKEILKFFFNSVKFCRDWEKDPTYIKVMDTVKDAQVRNGMDFPEALCYGIEQRKVLLRRKIDVDDDTSDEVAVAEEETKMDSTIKK